MFAANFSRCKNAIEAGISLLDSVKVSTSFSMEGNFKPKSCFVASIL